MARTSVVSVCLLMLIQDCGKFVLTKDVGRNEDEHPLMRYKLKGVELPKENESFLVADFKRLENDKNRPNAKDDVFFDLMPVESVMIGKPIPISVQVENRGDKDRTVTVNLGADSIEQDGKLKYHLNLSEPRGKRTYEKILSMAPDQKEIVYFDVTPDLYLDYLSTPGSIQIFAVTDTKETGQHWFAEDNVPIFRPKLHMEMPKELSVGIPFTLKLQFTNPLARELKNCVFQVQGTCLSGVQSKSKFKYIQSKFRHIQPNENVTYEMKLTPEHPAGSCIVVADFSSDKLSQVINAKKVKCS